MEKLTLLTVITLMHLPSVAQNVQPNSLHFVFSSFFFVCVNFAKLWVLNQYSIRKTYDTIIEKGERIFYCLLIRFTSVIIYM